LLQPGPRPGLRSTVMLCKETHWMRRFEVVLLAGWLLASACGGDEPDTRLPYKPNSTSVINGDFDNPDGLALRVVTTPDGDECIDLDGACAKPQEICGDDGAADVLLGDEGEVLDVICYPTEGVAVESFEGPVEKVGNNVVLVFDDVDDGADVMGDVKIDGNNVTLWGHGPDTSVIAGDLTIDKNNSVVRGIRVEGDVTIHKNNPSMVDCVIEGDLTIKGNNVSIALCEVWGNLKIEGNNTVLVDNRFAGQPEVKGENTLCAGNFAFADADGNASVSEQEVGEPIECATKSEK
jgi:carbonic anhydrase/acetyltransferase-like protein (isoleucine patch superfamily)